MNARDSLGLWSVMMSHNTLLDPFYSVVSSLITVYRITMEDSVLTLCSLVFQDIFKDEMTFKQNDIAG